MDIKLLGIILLAALWNITSRASGSDKDTRWCYRQPEKCANVSVIDCSSDKYRTLDGSCNNPFNPTLGMAVTTYKRLLPADYGDGISSFRAAKTGNSLPSARLLSFTVFGRETIPDLRFTLLNMQWGQLVTHDSSNRMFARGPSTLQTCCTLQGKYENRTSPPCFAVPVPEHDPYYKSNECLDFGRSYTDKNKECPGTEDPVPAEQFSSVTHYQDLSFVYGNSDEENLKLRALQGGLLKSGKKGSQWPSETSRPRALCPSGVTGESCFEFGDVRANQHTDLTIMQLTLFREHNRISRELAALNPHWDDDTLFQEARRINIAQFQYITYYEWSPITHGTKRLYRHKIIYKNRPDEYTNDYDPCVDPRSIQSFMHASFRYFHNQAVGHLQLMSESRSFNETIRLVNYVDRPSVLEQPCKYSSLVRGLSTQPQAQSDNNVDYAAAEQFFPANLKTTDIQRDRDHGIPSYNEFREYCGLKRASSWNDFEDDMSSKDVALLQTLYESHEDVDLSIGGSLERHVPGTLLGPTFLCINLIQFKNFRSGDRYFFENQNQPHPFTPEQLSEIRKASAARLLCDNAQIEYMQPEAFRTISKWNQLRPCSELPRVDLSKWMDSDPNF